MIIRTTFNDNDYTDLLEEYWDSFWFVNYYAHYKREKRKGKGTEIITEELLAEDLLKKAFYHEKEMTKAEIRKFVSIIRKSIRAYLREKHDLERLSLGSCDYASKRLGVAVVANLQDRDENGETVYYLLKNKTKVRM